jgi:TRAP transporter TAXI family solute receptor
MAMKRSMKFALLAPLGLVLAVALTPMTAPVATAQDIFIATGERNSTDFQIGRAICRLVNRQASELSCSVLETQGPLFNLSNVRGGAIEMGLAPADWQHHAVNHSGPFAFTDASYDNLRSVFSLHSEVFTLLARQDSGFDSLDALAGGRINIGGPGSVQRAVMDAVMASKGWTRKDFLLADELPVAQQSLALCHDRVQAAIDVAGHPSARTGRIAEICDVVVLGLSDADIEKVLSVGPYFSRAAIPGGLYAHNPEVVASIGLRRTLVTSSEVAPEIVQAVVAAVFGEFDRFRRSHVLLEHLEPAEMINDGLSAPLHEGARAYFMESGLM